MVGRVQEIAIGNMSGESNVLYWLRKRHIEPEPAVVQRILAAAKRAERILTVEDVYRLVNERDGAVGAEPAGSPERNVADEGSVEERASDPRWRTLAVGNV